MADFLENALLTAAIIMPLTLMAGRDAYGGQTAQGIVQIQLIVVLATVIGLLLQSEYSMHSRQAPLLILQFIGLHAVFSNIGAILLSILMRQKIFSDLQRRKVAIYGCCTFTQQACKAIRTSTDLTFAGLYDDRELRRIPEVARFLLVGKLNDLVNAIKDGDVDDVIILMPEASCERTAIIVSKLSNLSINVWICTPLPVGCCVKTPASMPLAIANATLSLVHNRAIGDWGYIAKSAFDRSLALLMFVALSPLCLAIAAAIKIDSGGPVFFCQRRHGFNGAVISVWKFRSMHTMEDSAQIRQATANDERVTRVGKWLRRTSLDELPQLINILQGDMSFVGPRPHAIAHNKSYELLIRRYTGRNQVKPGLTGWAQVNGLRGETKEPSAMARRVVCDLWYVANWSLLLDLKIIFLTPVYGLITRNAF